MIFDRDQVLIHSVVEILEEASATTGFAPAEMEALLDCELNPDQLLDYITAMVSNRAN